MNRFDAGIETFFSHAAWGGLLDHIVKAVADLYTFKGLVLIPILWWIWFQPGERSNWRREIIIATIASGWLALACGRLLAECLPFRVRPIYELRLHLHFTSAWDPTLSKWSSFPSDHAMLWMAVALGIFFIRPGIGLLAMLYTAVFICLPRAYLGFHYPTDLLAGAAIGVAITYVMTRDAVRRLYAPKVLRWVEHRPGLSAMLAFVVCLELVTQFDELRSLASSVLKAV
ncbi:phosphatase PAP2 family protein (plasmid) [Paraburkholderia sp. PREW-6R]|uniref:phosphatase PAP2 family protein n=1 Tax=Paraburkholderia sp. PREW-6R TaxID=3141544 RepID=UPI0031F48F14